MDKNTLWAWAIKNSIVVIAWVALAIVFNKWWIALFGLLFMSSLQTKHKTFRVCDKCGKHSPYADSYNEALDKAKEAGWKHCEDGNKDYCPDCQKTEKCKYSMFIPNVGTCCKADSLGDRMKENYENRAKTYLVRRMPVIIRLDGKAFHTFTKGLDRPYDQAFHSTMNKTLKYLCENIQGCKLGYTQSDEITLLLTDYDTLTTAAWFDYSVQKICSVSASMATLAFNKFFREFYEATLSTLNWPVDSDEYMCTLRNKLDGAMFDARCFNIPEDEVTNCFVWRQQDATRNAVQMLGQCNFSHNELQSKSCNDIQDMLMTQRGINFNDMPTEFKRGVCCYKTTKEDIVFDIKTKKEIRLMRSEWVIDKDIPIFTQDRDYIENTFRVRDEE